MDNGETIYKFQENAAAIYSSKIVANRRREISSVRSLPPLPLPIISLDATSTVHANNNPYTCHVRISDYVIADAFRRCSAMLRRGRLLSRGCYRSSTQ